MQGYGSCHWTRGVSSYIIRLECSGLEPDTRFQSWYFEVYFFTPQNYMNALLDTVSWFTVSPMIHSFAFRRKFSMSLRPSRIRQLPQATGVLHVG